MGAMETDHRTKIQRHTKSEWQLERAALYYEPGVLYSGSDTGMESVGKSKEKREKRRVNHRES